MQTRDLPVAGKTITWTNAKRKLSDLTEWDLNPASIDSTHAKRLEESLAEFGQVSTIAIDPAGMIVDGHQRKSVWALSQKFGPDYEVDVRIASRPLSTEERQRLAILLRSGAVGQIDWDVIASYPPDLVVEAGLDAAMLKALQRDETALANFQASEKQNPEFKEYDESIADGVSVCICPTCQHEHAKKD